MSCKINKSAWSLNDIRNRMKELSYDINCHLCCTIIKPYNKNSYHIGKIFGFCSEILGIKLNYNYEYLNKKLISTFLFEYSIPREAQFKSILNTIYEEQHKKQHNCYCYPYYNKNLWNTYVEIRDDICSLMVEMKKDMTKKDLERIIHDKLGYCEPLSNMIKFKNKCKKKMLSLKYITRQYLLYMIMSNLYSMIRNTRYLNR